MALDVGLRWVVFDRQDVHDRRGMGWVRSLHSEERDAVASARLGSERSYLRLSAGAEARGLGQPVWYNLERKMLILLHDARDAVIQAAAELDAVLGDPEAP